MAYFVLRTASMHDCLRSMLGPLHKKKLLYTWAYLIYVEFSFFENFFGGREVVQIHSSASSCTLAHSLEKKKNLRKMKIDAVQLPNLLNLAIVRLPCAQMPSLHKDCWTQEKTFWNWQKIYSSEPVQSRAFGTHLDQVGGYSQPRFDESIIRLLQ